MQDAANAETAGPRYEKDIAPFPQASQSDYPSVVRIWATDPDDEAQQVAVMVAHLKDSGVIERYGQVALLLSPNPPMGGMKAGQIGMREPTREKAWAPLGPM